MFSLRTSCTSAVLVCVVLLNFYKVAARLNSTTETPYPVTATTTTSNSTGNPKIVTEPGIVGGNTASRLEWRWQARLNIRRTDGRIGMCGGSFIHRQYVLTAAHCVCNMPSGQRQGSERCYSSIVNRPSDITVYLGDYRRSTTDTGEERVPVSQFWLDRNGRDAAVLRLQRPVSTNSYRQTIPLGCSTPRSGSSVWATGWGVYRPPSTPAEILQEIQLTVMSSCISNYICVNKPGATIYKNVCYGDSGGPLVQRNSRRQWELFGVTSHGSSNHNGCTNSDGYARFTSVPVMCSWIRSKIGGSGSCGGTVTLSTSVTSLRHPASGSQYGNNEDCEWIITARSNYRIQLRFSFIRTEARYDYVQVKENGRILRNFNNGSYGRTDVFSSGRQLEIKFHSDSSRTDRGFSVSIYPRRNPCSPNPCRNGGTCRNVGTSSYRCQCRPGYTGRTCSTATGNPCSPNPCRNGGTCRNVGTSSYRCQCRPGYTGRTCSTPTSGCGGAVTLSTRVTSLRHPASGSQYGNNEDCQWNITALSNYRIQLRYSFIRTEARFDYVQVKENGQILRNFNNGSYGRTDVFSSGRQLEIKFHSDSSRTDRGFYVLIYPRRNPCSRNPCRNGGTCRNVGTSSYRCQCRPGYTGRTCSTPTGNPCSPNPCRNGGTCRNVGYVNGTSSYRCQCRPGYTGRTCSTPTSGCGGAVTVSTRARLLRHPASGSRYGNNEDCQWRITARSNYRIQLRFSFIRTEARFDYVQVKENGRILRNFNNGSYGRTDVFSSGRQLEIKFHSDSSRTDRGFSVLIYPRRNPCSPNPCRNGGTCRNVGTSSYRCQCRPGYTGRTCRTPTGNPCSPNPCRNGGTCRNVGTSGYSCQCRPGYTGRTCGTNTTSCGGRPYNPATQICCGTRILSKTHPTHKCCAGRLYHILRHVCCRDRLYTNMLTRDCCGGRTLYNPILKTCCRNGLTTRSFTRECCAGTRYYNPSTHMCCGGRVYRWSTSSQCCGGTRRYNPASARCTCRAS